MKSKRRIALAVLILAAALAVFIHAACASGFEELSEAEEFSTVTVRYVTGYSSSNYKPYARIEIIDPDRNVIVSQTFSYQKIGDVCEYAFIPEKAGLYKLRGYSFIRTSNGETITTSIQEATLRVNHHWTDEEVIKEPTCSEEGQVKHTCTLCGVTQTDPVEKLAHTWGEWVVTKEGSCHEKGERTHTCRACGETETDETGYRHSWGEWDVTHQGDCTAEEFEDKKSRKVHTCTACGETETEEWIDHSWGEWEIEREATCTREGSRSHTCTRCGEFEWDQIPLAEHSWGEWEVTREPTFRADGERQHTCTACGEQEAEAVEKLIKKAGLVLSDAKAEYKLLKGLRTVSYMGPMDSGAAKVSIPATVMLGGEKFRVTQIDANACYGHVRLTSVSIGKNVTEIGDRAFMKCKALKKITIPAKVVKIGRNAFTGCLKLNTVSGMKAVTTIGDGAFENCTALTKFTIPVNVKKIGSRAFFNCSKLAAVTIKSEKLTNKNVGADAFGRNSKKAVYKVPKKKLKAYRKFLVKKGIPKADQIQ